MGLSNRKFVLTSNIYSTGLIRMMMMMMTLMMTAMMILTMTMKYITKVPLDLSTYYLRKIYLKVFVCSKFSSKQRTNRPLFSETAGCHLVWKQCLPIRRASVTCGMFHNMFWRGMISLCLSFYQLRKWWINLMMPGSEAVTTVEFWNSSWRSMFDYVLPIARDQWYTVKVDYGKACETLMLLEVFNQPKTFEETCCQYLLSIYQEQAGDVFSRFTGEDEFIQQLLDDYYFEFAGDRKSEGETDNRETIFYAWTSLNKLLELAVMKSALNCCSIMKYSLINSFRLFPSTFLFRCKQRSTSFPL